MGSNMEVRVYPASGDRNNKKERLVELNGHRIYSNNRRNFFNMGEAANRLIDALGLTTAIFAFIANLDNVIAWLLGAVAIVLGIIKCFTMYEAYLIKKLDRKQKARDFFFNRTIEESEQDEHPAGGLRK